jgi:hypothetical protein
MINQGENHNLVEDALSILEKSIDVSRLRPVRTQVHMRDGRVYTKTGYKKLTEAPANIQSAFTNQHELEQRGSAAIGQRVHGYWKGESTGQTYNSDLLKIKSIDTNTITLEFIAPFATGNRNGWTYEAGTTITVPKTGTEQWNESQRMDKYVAPVRVRPTPTTTTEEVTTLSQVSVGDMLTLTPRDGSAAFQIEVTSISHDSSRGYDFIKYRDSNGALKWVKVGSRNVKIEKTTSTTPEMPVVAGAQVLSSLMALKSEGYTISVNLPFETTITTRQPVQEEVLLDRYNRPTTSQRGSHIGHVTRFRDVPRPMTPQEIDEKLQEIGSDATYDTAQYKTLAKADLKEMLDGIKDEISAAGIRITKSDINLSINRGAGDMKLNINIPGLRLSRNFNISDKSVYHAYFAMDNNTRGDSLGKKIFKKLYKQYRNMEIKKISVSANIDVGCYAWSSYGFTAAHYDASNLISQVREAVGRSVSTVKKDENGNRVTVEVPITQAAVDRMNSVFQQYYRANGNSARIPMHLITAVAKDECRAVWVSNQTSWGGEIDLTNESQRTYFENYINRV